MSRRDAGLRAERDEEKKVINAAPRGFREIWFHTESRLFVFVSKKFTGLNDHDSVQLIIICFFN